MATAMIIGIVSDTHGILKPSAFMALKGVEHIVHAGDIGKREILEKLKELAPVTAVRGNIDRDAWAGGLAAEEMIVLNGKTFYVLHDVNALDLDPATAGVHAVISGHTHQPLIQKSDGVLYFNPGSVSQRRRGGPLSLGRIRISGDGLHPEIIRLEE